jgi:hypothetical protein
VIRLLVSGYADSIERYSRHASLLNAAERAELLDPDFRLTGGVSSARGSRGALASRVGFEHARPVCSRWTSTHTYPRTS